MNVDTSVLTGQQAEETVDQTPKTGFEKWGTLIVLSLALAIIVIDTTLLNVSLGTIIRDLHTNIQSIQWVITAYSLMLAAFTITGGRLGDLFGRKKMFMLGAVIFAIGSFTASISKSVGILILGESIIEGIGAAMMMPATASLLVANYKGQDRATAFGVWGGIAAAASAIGPILGGWLTSNYSWRWGFRINVFVVLLLLAGSFVIKESRDLRHKITLDWGGVVLSALGMLSIVFGVIKASDYGWFKAKEQLVIAGHALNLGQLSVTPIFVVIGILILIGFAYWEKFVESRGSTPLVSLHILQNKVFSSGVATTAVLALGQSGLIFSLPVFLQAVRKLDALHTGLAMLPLSLALLVGAPFSAYIGKRFNAKPIIQAGLLLNVAALAVLWASTHVDSQPKDLFLGMVMYGLGMGLVFGQISNLTLSSVTVEEAGEASGINNTLRQVGSTFGSAIIGAILLSTLTASLTTGVNSSPIIPIQVKAAITQNLSAQTSNVEFGGGAQIPGLPGKISDEIERIGLNSTTDGARTALLYSILFAFMGFLVSFLLPKEILEAHDVESVTNTEMSKGQIVQAAPVLTSHVGGKPEESTKMQRYAPIAGIILLLAAVALGSYTIGRHNTNNTASTDQNGETLQRADVPILGENPSNNQTPSSTTPQKNNSSPNSAPSNSTPSSTSSNTVTSKVPATPTPVPTTQTYLNNSIGLQFVIPASWTMHESFGSTYTADFYQQGKWVAGLSVNPTSNQSVSELYQEISSDPQNSNIQSISINGASGYSYYSAAHKAVVRAVVHRSNTYFFFGDLNSGDPAGSIKFF